MKASFDRININAFVKQLLNCSYRKQGGRILSKYYAEKSPNPITPEVFIPPLYFGMPRDIILGDFPVFTGGDKGFGYTDKIKYNGIQEYIITLAKNGEIPIYISDNHNHALFGWTESRYLEKTKAGALLIHIDDHADLDVPEFIHNLNIKKGIIPDLRTASEFTKLTWIREFIWPAFDWGLFKQLHAILPRDELRTMIGDRSRMQGFELKNYSLNTLKNLRREEIVVDIDLDYAASAGGIMPAETMGKIIDIARLAGAVTLATSPSCVNQEKAVEAARQIIEALQASPIKKVKFP